MESIKLHRIVGMSQIKKKFSHIYPITSIKLNPFPYQTERHLDWDRYFAWEIEGNNNKNMSHLMSHILYESTTQQEKTGRQTQIQ